MTTSGSRHAPTSASGRSPESTAISRATTVSASAAVSAPSAAVSASATFERSRLALFRKGTRGLLEVLAQVELERGRLHHDLPAQLVHVPAARAHGGAHAQRRVLADGAGQLARDVHVGARRGHPVDEA